MEHKDEFDFITLGKEKIPKGVDVTVNLELPKLYNTPTKLPIHVIRGKKEGPCVFVSAAVHGDELNGIEIIRRLRKLNILRRLRGTLILVPIVNVYGTMTLSRYMPDRRDLNRSFPGSNRGSLASRVANIFFKEVVSICDYGIDLHTASIHKSNLPQIRTNIKDEFTYKLAKSFEAPVVLHSELRDGSLRQTAQEEGIPILLYEAGEALRFDETCIRIGVKGIVNVLRELHMLPITKRKSKKLPIITKSSQWIRAGESGVLRTIKALGDIVKKEDIIAYIDEPLGNASFEVKSSFDGIIIGKSEIPLVQEGDAIFHIAKFKNLEIAETKIEYFSEEIINESEFVELNKEEIIE
ncbi:peptidase M14 family metallocarboxypeptidase, succinylglutamate desuccinylase/aspartoacylase-like protein [Malaciobacter molluscorum LMG 25693]|uniref:Peptidase M14 family metallocarboxypeptidase, succinylglutamate desuccinylase/aspartoacylase-like protein n=1 Tax=Malaciobacter molluscorum LMG 25693 TaxID=870501 RepID=A0AB33GLV3_9BACT|nr:succinylglutamate desuccinylase/aspartoacylase family protein [Malaciobacter molluscorum]AXX92821.1 peptidase M14 family metallocarboxypeptidase, succinylglutamate desuccinylase/aspartoacylase-like protein [Malaciobacter molluscorum LMG 25693]